MPQLIKLVTGELIIGEVEESIRNLKLINPVILEIHLSEYKLSPYLYDIYHSLIPSIIIEENNILHRLEDPPKEIFNSYNEIIKEITQKELKWKLI
jgi:hypothetical protein